MGNVLLNAFKLWSLFHLAFFLAPWVVVVLLHYLFRNKSKQQKRTIGLVLSLITVVDLVIRNVEIFISHNYELQPDIIPLQVCHLATFILVGAFLFRSNTLFAIAFCFNLPLALLSIVFAGGFAIMPTLLSFKAMAYLFGHTMIVGLSIWAFTSGLFQIDWPAQLKSMIIIFLVFVFMILINNINNNLMPNYVSNYFFTYLPEPGTPLMWFYEWGQETTFLGWEFNWLYLLLTTIFGCCVYFLSLGAYHLIKRFQTRTSIN